MEWKLILKNIIDSNWKIDREMIILVETEAHRTKTKTNDKMKHKVLDSYLHFTY